MAYDRAFLRITWLFTIINTDEIAMTSLNFSEVADPSFNAPAALAEINMPVVGPLLGARMATLLESTAVFWADYSRLVAVRIAAVTAAGPEFDPAKTWEDGTPAAGNNTQIIPQASVVMSLRSGSSTGSANYGRMYLPHTEVLLADVQPRAAPATTAAFVTAAQSFIAGVQADLDAAITPRVDPMIMTQVVGGTSKRITQVAIGDIVDTQRRRRNQLPENYAFATVP